MVRKKIDNRIRIQIENGVALGHRSMFVVVGDKGRDQIVILHHMLTKSAVRAQPSVLWCYKKDLGFSSHRKKRMKKLQKQLTSGQLEAGDDPFELFVASTNIRYTYYAETHKILGNTFGMCVLQDFEMLTPNLLARTIETVEGGGLIVLLLKSMTSLRQLYTMTMDVHARYRTEQHQDVVGRFNERFLLSLASCKKCIVVDDQLNILPISSHCINITSVPPKSKDETLSPDDIELKNLKESMRETQPVGNLVNNCKTLDQAKAFLKFVEAITDKTLRTTVTLTAARGRGKSAALGLAISAAVAFGYSNIFVTSPSPENLKTLFEFICKGFDSLDYEEHHDYDLIQSTNPKFGKTVVVRIDIHNTHRQTVQYIHPSDGYKLEQAELVVIDEAAAIPLPLVKALMGPYLVFMSSTINGYEGTGRSLSLKLIQHLRQQTATFGSVSKEVKGTSSAKSTSSTTVANAGRVLHEVKLEESIRYRPGDDVEAWLNSLLCLDATISPTVGSGCPLPENCDLYYVNRDTLFCYHKASEAFLQRLVSLYVASHYKNSPNDLQMMSDAPAHHLFCLLGPVNPNQSTLPEVLCVVQVCLEGVISQKSIFEGLRRGKRSAGDLIPWTIAQQFQDQEFPGLSGARIVRIATHPDYQGNGYGSRALALLQMYYEGKIACLDETNPVAAQSIASVDELSVSLLEEKVGPRLSSELPPLLLKLSERPAESLDYVGVSYGLTYQLLKFWKKAGFVPVYLRQTPNDVTGENSIIMLSLLNSADTSAKDSWLGAFWKDFRKRLLDLLGFEPLRKFSPSLALSILKNKVFKDDNKEMSRDVMKIHFSDYDAKRLNMYSQMMADHHLVTDLIPALARLYFQHHLGSQHISPAQEAILLGLGLQRKSVDEVAKELPLEPAQLLALFNPCIRKFAQYLNSIREDEIGKKIPVRGIDGLSMDPVKQTLDEELAEAAKAVRSQLGERTHLSKYAIKGSEDDWVQATLESKGIVSMKSINEKRKLVKDDDGGGKSGNKSRKKKKPRF